MSKSQEEAITQWPTQSEAAIILQTSTKTIERHAKDGRIEMRKRQRPGKKPENVCNPADINRLKPSMFVPRQPLISERFETAHREITNARNAEPGELALMQPGAGLGQIFETIATTIQTMQTVTAQAEKLVLTLKESARCGFSVAYLRRAIETGRLKSFRDGRTIKIAREDLRKLAVQ